MKLESDFVEELERAFKQNRNVCFITGSGTTCPSNGRPGIPGCSEIVSQICSELGGAPEVATILAKLRGGDVSGAYSDSIRLLHDYRGWAGVALLVQRLIDNVYFGQASTAQAKQTDHASWRVREGVLAMGKLLAKFPQNYSFAVTSNFDPLIEVAIRRAGANPSSVIFNSRTAYPFDLGRVPVLHVHGFWAGDTMHSSEELTATRPTLDSLMQREFESLDSQPVVIGYGGWTDSIMKMLASCIANDHSNKTLFWALFETGDSAANARKRILDRLSQIVPHKEEFFERRIVFFSGVDSDRALPAVCERVEHYASNSADRHRAKIEAQLASAESNFTKLAIENAQLVASSEGLRSELDRLKGRLREKDELIQSDLKHIRQVLGECFLHQKALVDAVSVSRQGIEGLRETMSSRVDDVRSLKRWSVRFLRDHRRAWRVSKLVLVVSLAWLTFVALMARYLPWS